MLGRCQSIAGPWSAVRGPCWAIFTRKSTRAGLCWTDAKEGLRSSVWGPFFWAPLRESKPHQRLDILRHFMKSSMNLFGPLSGVFFWERCLELRIGYFMGRVALLHWLH